MISKHIFLWHILDTVYTEDTVVISYLKMGLFRQFSIFFSLCSLFDSSSFFFYCNWPNWLFIKTTTITTHLHHSLVISITLVYNSSTHNFTNTQLNSSLHLSSHVKPNFSPSIFKAWLYLQHTLIKTWVRLKQIYHANLGADVRSGVRKNKRWSWLNWIKEEAKVITKSQRKKSWEVCGGNGVLRP